MQSCHLGCLGVAGLDLALHPAVGVSRKRWLADLIQPALVLPLDECVRRFQRMCGCDAVRALEAATLHPAQVLGIEATKGTLAFGADADLILLDDEMRVHATYVAGHHAWTLADSAAAESGRDAAPSGAPRLLGATRSRATPPGDEDGAGPARKRRQR